MALTNGPHQQSAVLDPVHRQLHEIQQQQPEENRDPSQQYQHYQLADGTIVQSTEVIQEPPPAEEDAPVIDITINNVVSSFNTRCHLNLRTIAMEGMHVMLKRESGMVSMKLRKPYTTASIWSSGKITCTGATSEEEAKVACRRFARRIQRIGFRCRFTNFRVVNVLGTCSLPFGIKINSFSKAYPREASYEPELHPGVTYRIKEPKATLKIFSTGSITVTAPRVFNVQMAIEHIFPLVYEYRRDKATLPTDEIVMTESYLTDAKAAIKPKREGPVVEKPPAVRKLAPHHLTHHPGLPKRPKEDWSDTSEDEFDSDDSDE